MRRGDVYRSRGRRGFVHIKVTHVNPHGPWVTVHRVGATGRRVSGRFTVGPLTGCRRSEDFTVYLTNRGDGTDVLRMPAAYEAT